ncbi:pilus assembly protein PilM [Candidatus Giovannonibacteria bacterium]|nr:pilus assembly protein PilM [Candidatus Giovannonibacteria bacterium]
MVPKFLNFPIFALDISDTSFKYLCLEENKEGMVVSGFGEGEVEPGIIERGEIKKKNELVSILKNIFREKNAKYVALSLPDEKGYFRTIRLQGVAESEAKNALELQLEEYVPLPPAEVVFDYDLAEKGKDHIEVFMSAYPAALVESYLASVSEAGALPVFLESGFHALFRSILPKGAEENGMLLDWGKNKITFSIFEKGTLRVIATVPLGGKTVNEAIAKTMQTDLKHAEELKIKVGFRRVPGSEEVFEAMIPMITSIREEIDKYINYYETHSESGARIATLYMAGGDSNLVGLREYLSSELKLRTMLANPWQNVSFPPYYLPDLVYKDSLRFATAIGLALGGLEKSKYI